MEASETTKVPQSFSSITHMDTRHLRWATCFATLVALCKGRDGQRWEDESRSAARRLHLPFRISFLASRTKKRLFGSMFKRSPDWQRLFETGEKLTPYKVPWRGKILPLLSPEVMLLAFIRTEDIPLAKHLQETGLLVDKLEEAAKRHIEKPEKLMFQTASRRADNVKSI